MCVIFVGKYKCLNTLLIIIRNCHMKQKIEMGFGPHLTMDLYGCDKGKLTDSEFIKNILLELPPLIGMTRISEPQVHAFSSNPTGRKDSFDQGGISAFVLIAESHITIHTFVAQQSAFVDIFSCKSFSMKKAENYLMKAFGCQKAERNLFSRGLEFPKNITVVNDIVQQERRTARKEMQ